MDIEMCRGEWCQLKHRCLRHTAEPSENQKYFKITPMFNNKCDLFLNDITKKK